MRRKAPREGGARLNNLRLGALTLKADASFSAELVGTRPTETFADESKSTLRTARKIDQGGFAFKFGPRHFFASFDSNYQFNGFPHTPRYLVF